MHGLGWYGNRGYWWADLVRGNLHGKGASGIVFHLGFYVVLVWFSYGVVGGLLIHSLLLFLTSAVAAAGPLNMAIWAAVVDLLEVSLEVVSEVMVVLAVVESYVVLVGTFCF
jgi:hypothetical protein